MYIAHIPAMLANLKDIAGGWKMDDFPRLSTVVCIGR